MNEDDDIDALLRNINLQIAPLTAAHKVYPDPVELAKVKFPDLQWDHVNPMSAAKWLNSCKQCHEAIIRGPASVRNIDTVFGDVIRGRSSCQAYQPDGSKDYELWDASLNLWRVGVDAESLCEGVRTGLREQFGRVTMSPVYYDYVVHPPPEPLECGAFIKTVGVATERYATKGRMPELDDGVNCRDRLLFSDGVLYNFKTREVRVALPEDRLYRRALSAYPTWDAPDAVKDQCRYFARLVKDFFLAGGKDLKPCVSGDVMECLENAEPPGVTALRTKALAILDELREEPCCRMLRGLYNVFEELGFKPT